jgi:hypothetical protein
MKSNKPDSSHFQLWKVAFRKNTHLLISVGYTAVRSKIESDEQDEEHITELIVCGMKNWIVCRQRNRSHLFEANHSCLTCPFFSLSVHA